MLAGPWANTFDDARRCRAMQGDEDLGKTGTNLWKPPMQGDESGVGILFFWPMLGHGHEKTSHLLFNNQSPTSLPGGGGRSLLATQAKIAQNQFFGQPPPKCAFGHFWRTPPGGAKTSESLRKTVSHRGGQTLSNGMDGVPCG